MFTCVDWYTFFLLKLFICPKNHHLSEEATSSQSIPQSVKRIAYKDLVFKKEDVLGEGVYGKYLYKCIQRASSMPIFVSNWSYFAFELLSHQFILYGAVFHPKAPVISLHNFEGHSVTVHSLCCNNCTNFWPMRTAEQWKKTLYGVISAVCYAKRLVCTMILKAIML